MFKIHAAAQERLEAVSAIRYIRKNLANPMAAASLRSEIKRVQNLLKENPHRRPLVHDAYLAEKGIYSISVKNYLIFYNIDEDNQIVNLLHFMHSSEDWISRLSKEQNVDA
jgi:mRNA-degrading endonuclease RelE of RelBE toxin-antitoxin system